jgi:hypothetical protein
MWRSEAAKRVLKYARELEKEIDRGAEGDGYLLRDYARAEMGEALHERYPDWDVGAVLEHPDRVLVPSWIATAVRERDRYDPAQSATLADALRAMPNPCERSHVRALVRELHSVDADGIDCYWLGDLVGTIPTARLARELREVRYRDAISGVSRSPELGWCWTTVWSTGRLRYPLATYERRLYGEALIARAKRSNDGIALTSGRRIVRSCELARTVRWAMPGGAS